MKSGSTDLFMCSVCSHHRALRDPLVFRVHSALQDPEAMRYRKLLMKYICPLQSNEVEVADNSPTHCPTVLFSGVSF